MATFETYRPLWVANFEIFAQMVSQPEARKVIAEKLDVARTGLAAMFLNQDESTITEHTTRTIGTFLHVLLSGLVLQWLIDPTSTLSAKGLTEALRATAESLEPNRMNSEMRPKGRRGKRKKL
jgi:hypothetical protein